MDFANTIFGHLFWNLCPKIVYIHSENVKLKYLKKPETLTWYILCILRGFWASYGQIIKFGGIYQVILVLLKNVQIYEPY